MGRELLQFPTQTAPRNDVIQRADVNCDGVVDAGDILVVRATENWNQCPPQKSRSDIDGSGCANAGDILTIRAPGVWLAASGLTLSACMPQPSAAPMNVASRSAGVAPLSVFFNAATTNSGVIAAPNADARTMHYLWDFDDPQSGVWSQGSGSSQNQAVGSIAAHVFNTPGIYNVHLMVRDAQGQAHTYVQQIEVRDLEGDSSWTTYYVSPSGSDSNSGRSVQTPLRTFEKAATLIGAKKRILFERGGAWTVQSGMGLSGTSGIIGAYGAGPKPQLILGSAAWYVFKVWGTDWRISDVRLIESGNRETVAIDAGSAPSRQLLLQNVEIHGFNAGYINTFYPLPVTHTQNFIVGSEFYGQRNKAVFIGGTENVLLGNYLHDTGSHIVRMWHGIDSIIGDNRLYRPLDPIGAVIKLHNATEVANLPDGKNILISGNLIEGHTWAVTVGTQGGWANETVRNVTIERNFVQGSSYLRQAFRINAADVVARNNIGDLTSTPADASLFWLEKWGIAPEPYGVKIFNNQVYRSDALASTLIGRTWSDTVVKNNIAWSPSSLVTLGATNAFTSNNVITEPGWMDPANGDFRLSAGSPALDMGTSVDVLDDFMGIYRFGSPGIPGGALDVGALESPQNW